MKRVLSFLLALVMIFAMLPNMPITAEATAPAIKTNLELAKKAEDVAKNYKTLYVMGGWGGPLTASNKTRFINAYSYNQQASRTKMINAASSDTFAFDCVCLIKGLLWGWDGTLSDKNGGAKYATNGVPDVNADGMINKCYDVSTDFSKIEIGEIVWMSGHVGVYIGNGLAVECTPAWKNCVQITACNRNVSGYNRRDWVKHGKLPYISYVNPCAHSSYNNVGACKSCGYKYPWTVNTAAAGTYLTVKEFNPRVGGPYDAETKDTAKTFKQKSVVQVTGSLINAFGNKWYQISYDGKVGYVYETYIAPCSHEYNSLGICKYCKQAYPWTLNTADAGTYFATQKINPHTGSPYGDAPFDTGTTFNKGSAVTVTGSLVNSYNHKWYQIRYGSGKIGYVYGEYLIKCSHIYASNLTKKPTCETNGVITNTCTKCGNSYTESVAATGHSYTTKVTTAATCTNFGVKTSTCKTCGHGYSEQIPATGHSYTSKVTTAATCSKKGVKTYTCSKCSHSYTEELPMTGHSYTSKVTTAATCAKKGVKTYTCGNCGHSYTEAIPMTGHSYTSKVTTAAKCTTTGVKTYTCSGCQHSYTEEIPAIGHLYSSKEIPATCLEYAKVRHTCLFCGDAYEELAAPTMSEWSTVKPEGIDSALIETRTEYRYKTKSYTTSTSSSLDGWTQYATTTQAGDYGAWSNWSDTPVSHSDSRQVETRVVYGYYYFKCPKCGAHMHVYGTCYKWAGGCGAATNASGWHEIWSTTSWNNANLKDWHGTGRYYTYLNGELVFKWNDGGSKTQYRYRTRAQETVYAFYKWSDWSDWNTTPVSSNADCKVETRTVYRYYDHKRGEHSYQAETVPATCTEQGYTNHTCATCGDSYQDNEQAALGHIWGETNYKWNSDYSKCTATRCCMRNGSHTETKTANSISSVKNPATCTEKGTTAYTAVFKGDRLDNQTIYVQNIPKLPHNFVNGACVYCATPDYLRGDLDNNGIVDDEDVIYLLWHTLMPADYAVSQNVDFDRNGIVDDEDVIYLLWHTLMPGDYPL